MKFTLPLPPPENERLIYAPNLRRMILSKKYRDYKKMAGDILLARRFNLHVPLLKPTERFQLAVGIKVYLPNRRRDGHGILKPLLDVMEGTVYDNDKWVIPRFYQFEIDSQNPHVEIEI